MTTEGRKRPHEANWRPSASTIKKWSKDLIETGVRELVGRVGVMMLLVPYVGVAPRLIAKYFRFSEREVWEVFERFRKMKLVSDCCKGYEGDRSWWSFEWMNYMAPGASEKEDEERDQAFKMSFILTAMVGTGELEASLQGKTHVYSRRGHIGLTRIRERIVRAIKLQLDKATEEDRVYRSTPRQKALRDNTE